MQLLVLGASGGIGRWVVRLAAARGHGVRALLRSTAGLDDIPAQVDVRRGDALDSAVLTDAVAGSDAVISCLGQRRAGQSPWSAPLSPPDLLARVTPALVAAMNEASVRRLVVVSAAGVGESFARLSAPVRWLVRQGQLAVAYHDLEMMERILATSGLDWLAVRPVTLVNGPPTAGAREVQRYGLTSRVRRADVAAWMVEAVEARRTSGRTVLLG